MREAAVNSAMSHAENSRSYCYFVHREYRGLAVTGEENGRLRHGNIGFLLFLTRKDHVACDESRWVADEKIRMKNGKPREDSTRKLTCYRP